MALEYSVRYLLSGCKNGAGNGADYHCAFFHVVLY